MHSIVIRYVGLIRNTLSKQEETVEIKGGATLRDLLALLTERYGDDFRTLVFGADGRLRSTTNLLLDGADAAEAGGLDASLEGVAKLSILALVHPPAGG